MINRKDIQFINLCVQASKIFSTCGKKKYAAVLVDDCNHIVGFGYNGGPSGHVHCEDGGCPRLQENSPSGSKYDNCIAVHAEANALLHSDYTSNAKKIYINGPPCFDCAKLIANTTIKKIYYINDITYIKWKEIKNFLNRSGIETVEVSDASI